MPLFEPGFENIGSPAALLVLQDLESKPRALRVAELVEAKETRFGRAEVILRFSLSRSFHEFPPSHCAQVFGSNWQVLRECRC